MFQETKSRETIQDSKAKTDSVFPACYHATFIQLSLLQSSIWILQKQEQKQ